MGNRKDIGKLFNERFKDFEQAPGADLWDTIASELDQKSDRRIAPFWLYFGGVLIVGMLTGILYWAPWSTITPNTKEEPEIVSTTQDSQNEITNTSTSVTGNNTAKEKTNTERTDTTSSTISQTETIVSQNNTLNNNDTTSSIPRTTNTSGIATSSQNTNIDNTENTVSNTTTKKTTTGFDTNATNSSIYQTTTSTYKQNEERVASIIEVLRTMKSASQEAREQKELEAKTAYQAKIKEELATAIAAQKEDSKITTQKWLDSLQAIEKAEKIKKEALATATAKEEKPIKKKVPKLPKTDEEREQDRKESVNYKFAISPYTSLLSYGSLTKGSSIDNRLVDNPRDAIGTIGYGIRADYKFSERSSIRFGIGLAPLQYKTDDFQVLITNNTVNIFQLSGIDPQNLEQSGGIDPSPEALAFFNSNDVVSIEQDISYIEVPIDYQYRFLNKRLSMSFNTGLSLFVLTNNRVFATADSGESIFIGRETSLKDLSLALNLGLGTHYNFSDKWRLDVEPAFKYQLNPYTDNIGNFKPYYLGLQFGISYKF